MQAVLAIADLPPGPTDAAATFHAHWLDRARDQIRRLGGADRALLILLPEADHTHADWRLAAARTLAREAAPARVNLVGCNDAAKAEEFAAYLRMAPGVTGQYFPVNFQLGR